MQTFLPDSSFQVSAQILDWRRCGKQRVESYQILKGDFPNHPACRMWAGYHAALASYGLLMCQEWIKRGYKDSLTPKFLEYIEKLGPLILPPWIGGPIHSNHRARLLAKDFNYYSQFGWSEKPTETNYWPVKKPYIKPKLRRTDHV